jgi:serine/threonine protein kinase
MSQGTIIGTPHYISPEQALGQSELDARTDVYSVGVVLYELVVGRVPFAGDTPFSIVHDHIYTPLPMPREVNPSVSLPVESVLVKALAKDPDSRYQNITVLMSEFRAAAQGEDAGQPAPARAKQPPSPAVTAVESAPDPFPGPAAAREPGRVAPPRPPSPPIPSREGGQERRTNLSSTSGPGRPGRQDRLQGRAWAESVEAWAEQFEEDGKSKGRSRRKKELTPEEQIRLRVEKRIKARQELIAHAAVYIIVNALLWVIWLLASSGRTLPAPDRDVWLGDRHGRPPDRLQPAVRPGGAEQGARNSA